jgi:hypothetical protein
MKYDLFIKTLERGRDIGLGTKFNISDILQKEFKKPVSVDINNWNPEVEIQFDVLRDMQTKLNIIKFDSMETNRVRWDMSTNKPIWFDETPFEVWVTVTGLDYLNQFYLRESNFRLNDTLRANADKQTTINQTIAANSKIQATDAQKQTKIFRWTAIFAFVVMIISGITLWRDSHKDTLQQQLKQKDSVILQLQKKVYLQTPDSSLSMRAKKNLQKKP